MDEMAAFVRQQPTKQFAKETTIVYQGESSPQVYGIRSGFVKIYDLSADGNEQLLGLAGKYDFIPSETLFSGVRPAAQFFYSAFTDVETFVVDRNELTERLRGNAEALYATTQTVYRKYHGLLRHLNAAQKPKAREKIIYVLHFLGFYFVDERRRQNVQRICVPLTQQDIANLVGVTRETAAHELKQLKREGHIVYDKSAFYIGDSLATLAV